jgi:uncharacterized protein YegL
MKTRIFNLIIIDESGSMCSIKKEAIDSVNETIQTIRSAQKKHEGQEHYVSLVTFNDDVKTVYDCVNVDEVKELNAETYRPDCCTALYDAMGISITALQNKVAPQDKVLVTVITDGYENASKEYSGKAVKALVEEMKSKGWVFAYIGANHDVEAVASTISISNVMKFKATHKGTLDMTKILSRARMKLYDSMSKPDFCDKDANENFFKED